MPSTEVQLATLAENLRHLTAQIERLITATDERFDRVEERLERGDVKFQAMATQASADAAIRGVRDKVGDVVLHLFSGSVGAGLLYVVSLLWPPKH